MCCASIWAATASGRLIVMVTMPFSPHRALVETAPKTQHKTQAYEFASGLFKLFTQSQRETLRCLKVQRGELMLGHPSMYTEKLNPDDLTALIKVENDSRPHLF